ncbi:hypothetical protein EX30DRAFT_270637 [Ascodesmis nigricans]|uniref:Uncharacterized protein n=1 Tax=Ascodesmis nigricans TaxID=341454 RepID=A0A4S2MX51_9PEZI|nr:hypothetical protein EX30DRAFT_270637 [Ascodesmis nigricans]
MLTIVHLDTVLQMLLKILPSKSRLPTASPTPFPSPRSLAMSPASHHPVLLPSTRSPPCPHPDFPDLILPAPSTKSRHLYLALELHLSTCLPEPRPRNLIFQVSSSSCFSSSYTCIPLTTVSTIFTVSGAAKWW